MACLRPTGIPAALELLGACAEWPRGTPAETTPVGPAPYRSCSSPAPTWTPRLRPIGPTRPPPRFPAASGSLTPPPGMHHDGGSGHRRREIHYLSAWRYPKRPSFTPPPNGAMERVLSERDKRRGLALWVSGVLRVVVARDFCLAWSMHTTSQAYGEMAFWAGLGIGNGDVLSTGLAAPPLG